MQTPIPKDDPYILVEFNGTRKAILKEKLPEAQQMAAEMQALALKAGYPQEEAEKLYTLKIVKDAP